MAGETALARQLKKLAVPQTSLLLQDKIRKSFLFDHRDAAGLDRDIIYAYGTNGLEKLCHLNPNFSKFEANLFNFTYQDFERSVQTEDVNAKLDKKLSEFLKMLSPWFLTRGAYEALEWLIYRFHIHMFNIDDLIASALPHYNTSAFVRVIQLLDLDEQSRWFWLKPIQKSGVHLDYSAVLNRFISDKGFRKFICNIAPDVVSVHQDCLNVAAPIVSFSMITIYNALIKCQSIDDNFVIMMFPYVLKGLKSGLDSYIAASYLIISQIVVKVQLTDDIIQKLLVRVFQHTKDLFLDALQLLLLVFQNQSFKKIPNEVFAAIASKNDSVNKICYVNEKFDASCLIKAIFKKTLNNLFSSAVSPYAQAKKKQAKLLKGLLTEVNLDEKSVIVCFNFTVKKYVKCTKMIKFNKTDTYDKIAEIVFKHLEKRHPDHFDKALKRYSEKDPKLLKKVYSLISNSVCNIKHKIVKDIKTPIVLGLNHPNPIMRKTSVLHLVKTYEKNGFPDEKFLVNSVCDRLLDDNPDVVQAVVESLDIIQKLLDLPKIICLFEKIFERKISVKSSKVLNWYSIFEKCLQFTVKNIDGIENPLLLLPIIVKFIFPVNENTMKGLMMLLESDYQNFLLQELREFKADIPKEDMNEEKYIEVNSKIILLLKRSLEKLNQESIDSLASFLSSKIPQLQSYSFMSFYMHVMGHLIIIDPQNAASHSEEFFKVMRFYFSNSDITGMKLDDVSELSVMKQLMTYSNEFPISILFYALKNVIEGSAKTVEYSPWPDTQSQAYRVHSQIFDFCILGLNFHKKILKANFKNLLSLFIQQFKNTESAFKFLCTKWISYKEDVPLVLQLSSLQIAITLCNSKKEMDWLFEDDAIFFCLLKAISDPHSTISQLALNILTLSLNSSKNTINPLRSLAVNIISRCEEIKIDCMQCFNCVENFVKPAAEQGEKIRKANELQMNAEVLDKILVMLNLEYVPYSVKKALMICLHNVNTSYILSAYIPLLNVCLSELQKGSAEKEKLLSIIELSLNKFNSTTAKFLADNSKEVMALFNCLQFSHENDADNSVQKFALGILSKEFFEALPCVKIQHDIFHILLELYIKSSSCLNSEIAKRLRKICSYAYIFLKNFLENELNVSKGSTLREAKKSKTGNNADPLAVFEKSSWKKMTVFLELMQNKSNLLHMNDLIPDLFNILNKSLDLENQASVEYLRQLILSVIYNCCQQLGSKNLDERQFQVELIVQCIRSSTNTKTHQQSLLLLNLAAKMFPDYVLSNVMSIFTFMGSSLVRQDDSYSFQIISQTIETIVPALLEASSQQTESSGVQVVASVIRVFVDSLADIPSHRQLPLFTKLLLTLDPSKYLWIPIAQICDQHAAVFHNIMTEESKNWKISPALEFAVHFHKQFSPNIQIDTCIELANLLVMLPDTKSEFESNPKKFSQFEEPINVQNRDDRQLQAYKYNVLSYMKIWLTSQEFLSQVSELNSKELHNLEVKYELLFETILKLLQNRLNKKENIEDRNISNQIQILYDLVRAINSLLPCNLFIRVTRNLLKNAEINIQLKAIEFLNARLEQQENLEIENKKALLRLLKPLLKLVENCMSEVLEKNKSTTLQTALYSLHLLCKLIGSQYPTKFYKVLKVPIQILTDYDQPEVMVNALLCLAQLCSCLNVEILPYLNSFMPIIVNILHNKRNLNNECLMIGIIAAMSSIIEQLGMFLSSYMEDIITGICLFSVNYSEIGKKNICDKLETLQSKIAHEIALRVLLSSIECSFSKITTNNSSITIPLMKILTEKINSSSYEEILAFAAELQKFYLIILDFRNCYKDVPLDITNNIEDSIISSFKNFVMKLSVSRFRTLFQKIYQWATTTIEDQEQKLRIYSFYKLTNEFSKSLKGLFSPMSKYFFKHIGTILASKSDNYFETSAILSYELLCNSIDTLNNCFMHAENQFLDKENFEMLLQPLVDQIENLSFEAQYQDLIENHLSSCIAYFMTAVSDNVLWKSLNYQILLKTRHTSPQVRFGSLQVIQEVVTKMGDNYLVLLPESIPFLAEIMEDESTEVEQECQNVIIEMEKILGEPIRKYF